MKAEAIGIFYTRSLHIWYYWSMTAFLKGLLVSLTLALSIGPGLVLQFQASVQRGFRAGCAVLGGRYLSDITLLSLSYIGLLQIMTRGANQRFSGLAGSLALVVFGTGFFFKKADHSLDSSQRGKRRNATPLYSYFLSSLTINTMNPFVCVFWIGLVAVAGTMFGIHSKSMAHFFAGLITGAIGFDLIKCYAFSRMTFILKPGFLLWINRATGIALFLAGIGAFIHFYGACL